METDRQKQFKIFEGKPIKILTKSQMRYQTENLQVFEDCIIFSDKFGLRVMIALEEIQRMEEFRNGF